MQEACVVRLTAMFHPSAPIIYPASLSYPLLYSSPALPALNRAGQVARTVWVLLDAASRHGLAGVSVPKERQYTVHQQEVTTAAAAASAAAQAGGNSSGRRSSSGNNAVGGGSGQGRGGGRGGGRGRGRGQGRGRGRGRGSGLQGRGGGSTVRDAGRGGAGGDDGDDHHATRATGSACEGLDAPEMRGGTDSPAGSPAAIHEHDAGTPSGGDTGDTGSIKARGDAALPSARAVEGEGDGDSDGAATADSKTGDKSGGGHISPSMLDAEGTQAMRPPKREWKGKGKGREEGDGEKSMPIALPAKPRMSQVS